VLWEAIGLPYRFTSMAHGLILGLDADHDGFGFWPKWPPRRLERADSLAVQLEGLFVSSESHFSISDGLTVLFGVEGFSVPALTSKPAAILTAANCFASDSAEKVSDRRE
jgi:hypothetical protein